MSAPSPSPTAIPRPAGAGAPVIVARDLKRSFGDVEAVRDVSFTVSAGQIVGLLGPNGAGKTTTVNLLTTLLPLDAGSAEIGGFDVTTQPQRVREVIGLAGQSAAVDDQLTGRENLELFGRLYKRPRAQRRRRTDGLIERFDLADFADRPAGTYSGGQRRRLDIAAALVADPSALFLDEPTTGLDPRSRAEVWQAIAALAAGGAAIVLTTQYLEEADRLADEILIVDQGRVIAAGTPEDLKRGLQRDVLEVRVGPDDLARGLELAGPDADAAQDVDAATNADVVTADGLLRIPVGGDPETSLELLRRLQDDGIQIVDFQLRRPTLDDVFLSLTGHPAAPQEVPA